MSDSETEFSPLCVAYESAFSAFEVARQSLKVAQARCEKKCYI